MLDPFADLKKQLVSISLRAYFKETLSGKSVSIRNVIHYFALDKQNYIPKTTLLDRGQC